LVKEHLLFVLGFHVFDDHRLALGQLGHEKLGLLELLVLADFVLNDLQEVLFPLFLHFSKLFFIEEVWLGVF